MKNHIFPVNASIPNGTKLGTEESIKINLQTTNGNSYSDVLSNLIMDQNFYQHGGF